MFLSFVFNLFIHLCHGPCFNPTRNKRFHLSCMQNSPISKMLWQTSQVKIPTPEQC
jgi:hypothetical protein